MTKPSDEQKKGKGFAGFDDLVSSVDSIEPTIEKGNTNEPHQDSGSGVLQDLDATTTERPLVPPAPAKKPPVARPQPDEPPKEKPSPNLPYPSWLTPMQATKMGRETREKFNTGDRLREFLCNHGRKHDLFCLQERIVGPLDARGAYLVYAMLWLAFGFKGEKSEHWRSLLDIALRKAVKKNFEAIRGVYDGTATVGLGTKASELPGFKDPGDLLAGLTAPEVTQEYIESYIEAAEQCLSLSERPVDVVLTPLMRTAIHWGQNTGTNANTLAGMSDEQLEAKFNAHFQKFFKYAYNYTKYLKEADINDKLMFTWVQPDKPAYGEWPEVTTRECGDFLARMVRGGCSPFAVKQVLEATGYNYEPVLGKKRKQVRFIGELMSVKSSIITHAVNEALDLETAKKIVDALEENAVESHLSAMQEHDSSFTRRHAERLRQYSALLQKGEPGERLASVFLGHIGINVQKAPSAAVDISKRFNDEIDGAIRALKAIAYTDGRVS